MKFDMNAVWSRGVDLARDNLQLLLVIAGVFLLLPTMILYLFIPDFQTVIDPTADPDIVAAQMSAMVGPLLGYGLLAAVFQFAGYGAMIALMGRARPTVGQAIATGITIVPSTFAVMILFLIVYLIGALVILVPISLLAGLAGMSALAVIGFAPVLIFIVWLMTRLSMTMPAMVLERALNPIKAMGRSFLLTGPMQWSILLFWGALFLVVIIVSVLLTGFIGVIAALAGGETIAALIAGFANGATTMASGIIVCAVAVAMFEQLSGPDAGTIAETFE